MGKATYNPEWDGPNRDRSGGESRIWNDSAEGAVVSDPDPATVSPEAMKVLLEKGVAAYQQYLRDNT